MAATPFKVVIEDLQEKYSPGQSILGKVCYYVNYPHAAEIRVRLIGEESTYQSVVTKRWTCNFLETSKILIYTGELQVGHQEFPFLTTLPRCIPSSYIGKYGHVKFFLIAYLDRTDMDTQEDVIAFRVFSPIDLNHVVNLYTAPTIHFDELLMDKWCCVHEEISMEVKLEREAFIVGDVVNVTVVLRNTSILYLTAVKVKLAVSTQAKVATPRQEFLNCYSYLDSNEDYGVGSYKNRACTFHLKIPPLAEVPNFQKCSLFSQTALLEVIGVISDSSKPNLKVEINLVLGHIPLDESSATYYGTAVKEKPRLPDPVLIRPLPYGIHRPLSVDAPSQTSENIIPPKAIPPYPTSSDSNLFPPDASAHPISATASLEEVPLSVALYENPLYSQDTRRSLSPRQNNCPYPIEAKRHSAMSTSAPSLPYPVKNNCPYPIEQVKISLPYPATTNPPYPKEEIQPTKMPMPSSSSHSSFESDPPYPTVKNPPYPREDDHARKESRLPTKMPMPSRSFSGDNISYSTVRTPPYPKEGNSELKLTKMPMPMSLNKDLPHPKDERKPPDFPKMPMPHNPPYPRDPKEEPEFPKMPMPCVYKPFKEDNILRPLLKKSPSPTHRLTEMKDLSNTTNTVTTSSFSTPPYPVTPPSPNRPRAPYPIEEPRDLPQPHHSSPPYPTHPTHSELASRTSTLSFTTPLSTNTSRCPYPPISISTANSIGSAGPTSGGVEPSAPPITGLPTPPTTGIEVSQNIIFTHHSSSVVENTKETKGRSPPPTYDEVLASIKGKKKVQKWETKLPS